MNTPIVSPLSPSDKEIVLFTTTSTLEKGMLRCGLKKPQECTLFRTLFHFISHIYFTLYGRHVTHVTVSRAGFLVTGRLLVRSLAPS